MTGRIYKKCVQWFTIGIVFVLAGCRDTGPVQDRAYLIRVGKHVVTVEDFNEAFEIAKVAYPHNAMQDPVVLKETRLRFFNQLSDEMVLLARAKALKLDVTDTEVEKALARIQADYPEGTFKQTLLESAITFSSWKKRLKVRLLIGKVVNKDLAERVEISPEDVARYYGAKGQDGIDGSVLSEELDKIDETTVHHFRREKTEEAYDRWMKALKQAYTIEINQVLWGEILGA